ncbi:hypothetical protein PFAG_00258 [Plasmodium falciparum Santa Lucia]|uniref:Uncharacterized protein n=3 Tax=Plasmodium falciparum TaxID=5833 RepID=W7FLC6_PLAF8|nr:hypothetical protein PFNF135_00284 [Plasmodium falciparum NF135/5.C10]EUR79128.1 hypothetical protein PFBG_00618 [Plasmodium falciparum 7G8]EUT93130.1 hypothetical protein PFAG_00258 [Plasmodium falciparum Santa Lucia]
MNCLTKTFGKFISPIQVIICTSILYLFYKNVGITVFIFNKFEIYNDNIPKIFFCILTHMCMQKNKIIKYLAKPYINNIFEK